MQRRNPGATAALLQKANSQLKGEKIEKPEDELNKTSKQQKTVNFEDIGESISISSDIEDVPIQAKPAVEISSGNKFLKKKPGAGQENVEPAGNKFLKKPQPSALSPSPAVKSQPAQRYGSQSVQSAGTSRPGSQLGSSRQAYSALDKASALTGKIQQRAATRKTYTLESDSDESFSAVKLSRSIGDQLSDSHNSKTDSVKIGRDGGKFLKKATPSPAPLTSIEPPRASTAQQNKGLSPAKKSVDSQPQKKKASPFQLKSSLKYSTDVVLTSEEESLAEFVGGLPSSSDSMDVKPKRHYGRQSGRHTPQSPPPKLSKGRRSPSPPPPQKSTGRPSSSKSQGRSPSPQNKPPVLRRTPSPSPRNSDMMSPGLRRRSPSPKLRRSYSDDSNVAESLIDEVADDFGINDTNGSTPRVKRSVVVMDLDDLGPVDDAEPLSRPETPVSRADSPSVRSTARKSKKEKKGRNKSEAKTTSETSLKGKKKSESPFRAKTSKESSVFKASNDREKSPFKASSDVNDSPFKASNKRNESPFRAADSGSPFKAKGESSPFRASNEGSLFKASNKSSSPFRARSSDRSDMSDASRSSSPFKSRGKSSKKSSKKKKGKSSKGKSKGKKTQGNDLFSSFGLQTIDDLMGHSIKESEYDSVRSEVEEVYSDVSEEIRTEKPGAYSYSQKFEDTETEIATDYETTKPSAANYTEDFDSISEKIGYSSDRGRSSASEVRTKYSGDETVRSDSEFTESDTETVISESKYTDDDSDKTYSESYSEYSEDFTKSLVPTTSRSDVTPRPRRGMTSAEAQTAMDGILYSWDPVGSGLAFQGVPHGLHFVDPTPIATHVVSADALEAMTAYSPAMLALHDMLKSQMELTKEFLSSQKQLYEDYSRNVKPTFKYTTLEDTKKYIKKHRKKKLTFKEALQLVDLEMART